MILLYCDAGADLGIGHLMRNVALASAATQAGLPAMVCGNVTGDFARAELASAGVPFTFLGSAGELADEAVRVGAELVHLDHYGDFPGLRNRLSVSGIALSSMEDGQFGRRPADLVVDPTLGAQDAERPADGSGLLARGLLWAPIRPDVLAARQARGAAMPADRPAVLVVMGGTDACEAIGPVVDVLARCTTDIDLTVIAPRGRQAAIGARLPQARVIAPTSRLPELAAHSTVVLTAAGTTVWELACIGVPTALVAVTDNQLTGYRQAVAAGIGIGLGQLAQLRVEPDAAAGKLDDLLCDPNRLQNIAQVARRRADGRGAARIVGLWQALSSADPLHVRLASESDAAILLAWRNDSATRASSRSTDLVSRADHERWLATVLADSARRLYLGVDETGPVGTVRFDRLAMRPSDWEVSITVAPQARGRGLASGLLLCAERAWRAWAVTELPDPPSRLVAWMKTDNPASNRSFLRAGYREEPDLAEPGYLAVVKAF